MYPLGRFYVGFETRFALAARCVGSMLKLLTDSPAHRIVPLVGRLPNLDILRQRQEVAAQYD